MPACFNPTNVAANNITISSADFSWNAVVGSLGYEYAVTQSATGPASGTFTTATNCSVSGLTINTPYYFHVRNKCANTWSSWTTLPFTTADAYCKPPVNVLFNNTTITSTGVLWSSMPTATAYEYKYDITINIPATAPSQKTTGITANLTNLQPLTKYYFFLRSICLNGDDSSTWRIDSFITKGECVAPELSVQNPGANKPTVSWKVVPEAVWYEYRVTSSQLAPAFGTQLSDTAVEVELDPANVDQYMHVRAKCNSQFTFSEWSTVALRIATGISDEHKAQAASLYPNPAKGLLFIRNAAGATYRIADVMGRQLANGKINVEEHVVDLSGIAPGVYLVELQHSGEKEILRFTKN
jgi:hypothetical protein